MNNENTLNQVSWKIIEQLFKENEQCLVSHHTDSYNYFIQTGIPKIFKENNPCRYLENSETDQTECLIYLGGKDGSAVRFGKPVIYDADTNFKHYMYPNDARLRNMTYGVAINYDVDIDFIYYTSSGEKKIESKKIENVFLGKFPIMVQSNLCILKGLPADARFNLGECKHDYGGYFIIDGKEKLIISQEKFADNMLYIREYPEGSLNSHSAEIRSVSEDTSKPIRVNSVTIVAPTATYSNKQIVVNVPNVRKPVPLFILMRALGVESDKKIIEYCLLDLEKNKKYVDLFIPSVHHASTVFNQYMALEFIALLTKRQDIVTTHEILMNYFLAHIGTDNFINKAYFVGYMVRKLLRVYMKDDHPTDRDNFKCKRIELSGSLMYDLFREYYLTQKRKIELAVDRLHFNTTVYKGENVVNTFMNIQEIFKKHGLLVQDGVRKAFKGNWGSMQYTKRVGLVQDVARLSWFAFISHLRKVNLEMDPTSKIVKPHLLNNSQYGYIDPVDTPDGGNVGLHKHIAISTVITTEYSGNSLIKWLFERFPGIVPISTCLPVFANDNTKLFVNGNWVGLVINDPINMVKSLSLFKRNGIIPFHTSVRFNYKDNEITIYTDGGRMTRPLYYIDKTQTGIEPILESSFLRAIPEPISSRKHSPADLQELSNQLTWTKIVSGSSKQEPGFKPFHNNLYLTTDIVGIDDFDTLFSQLDSSASVVEYIDIMEEESALIAFKLSDITKFHTHIEIDPSLIFGVLGNSIIYPEHNQLPRDVFSCGQSKQAVSMYHTNYQMRLDKMSVVLQYGQTPLIKSRYLELMNNEEHPYGVNTIVAIMCYTGYNVEDAILINQGAVDRGLFRTTYYTLYETTEDLNVSENITSKTTLFDFKTKNVKTPPGSDYSFLDKNGVVIENTELNDKIVMIGAIKTNSDSDEAIDSSVMTKKGQLGHVDKTFITENEKGLRLAKIRVREERIPSIGDKMASRAGQKGTIGLIIPEKDMPYTSDGICPDIIINPHALPSRMTIGQLVESMFGKACLHYGAFGDCTAFATNGPNHELYGKLMTGAGFHSSGNQLLYCGTSGEQIESNIFIGPTYYMRLKHMVKDKINYRSNNGPNTMLTRQPVQGRANDGGLRIGEMERDAIMSHGMTSFLTESFLKRADEYYMAVCDKTGMIAVYNPDSDIFFSPSIDGPGAFGEINGKPIKQMSRFGRSFSVVRVPYSFKQLIQELQVINVQLRIITDNNVDQLLNMTQSGNINKLLDVKTGPDELSVLLTANKTATQDKLKKYASGELPITIETHVQNARVEVAKVVTKVVATPMNKPMRVATTDDTPVVEYHPIWEGPTVDKWDEKDTTLIVDLPEFPDRWVRFPPDEYNRVVLYDTQTGNTVLDDDKYRFKPLPLLESNTGEKGWLKIKGGNNKSDFYYKINNNTKPTPPGWVFIPTQNGIPSWLYRPKPPPEDLIPVWRMINENGSKDDLHNWVYRPAPLTKETKEDTKYEYNAPKGCVVVFPTTGRYFYFNPTTFKSAWTIEMMDGILTTEYEKLRQTAFENVKDYLIGRRVNKSDNIILLPEEEEGVDNPTTSELQKEGVDNPISELQKEGNYNPISELQKEGVDNPISELQKEGIPEGWEKHTSNKHKRDYYFNQTTGQTVWDINEIPKPKKTILSVIEEEEEGATEEDINKSVKESETKKIITSA
jgi:DNA-directed RNA polymerase II subunit RPB2